MKRALFASTALHLAAFGAFVALAIAAGLTSYAPRAPRPTAPRWVDLARVPAPRATEPGIAMPRPTPSPTPAPTPTPPPVKAARPTPRPTPRVAARPTPHPTPKVAVKPSPKPAKIDEAKRLAELRRKYPALANVPDDALRQLPPGMHDWSELASMSAKVDDHLDHLAGVPRLGVAASGSIAPATGSDSVIAALLNGFRADVLMDQHARQRVLGGWAYACEYGGTVFVARWPDAATTAQVTYFPVGGTEDPSRTFPVAVQADDDQLFAVIVTGWQDVQAGRPRTDEHAGAASTVGRAGP